MAQSPTTGLGMGFLVEVLGENLDVFCENNASGSPIYLCRAFPGTSLAATKWQIKKITYDAGGGVTDARWANGSGAFDKLPSARATYTYSFP